MSSRFESLAQQICQLAGGMENLDSQDQLDRLPAELRELKTLINELAEEGQEILEYVKQNPDAGLPLG